MIHSRPGFAPRNDDSKPAALNADMIPAINRPKLEEAKTTVKHNLDARTEAAYKKLQDTQAAEAAARMAVDLARVGPDILINPTPSEPPMVLEPGK